MRFRMVIPTALVLLSCASRAPGLRNQIAVPLGPLVAPKPVVMPAPVGLAPPAPFVVIPESQVEAPRPEASVHPDAPGSAGTPDTKPESARKGPSAEKQVPPAGAPARPECEPVPVPHLGGDALHDWCADTFPPNRFPGKDVLVNGKRFDALQVGAPVLWEIKTDRFETYASFVRERVIKRQASELSRERTLASACGYQFMVGVSHASHREALIKEDATLKVVVTGC